jgi:hypothetical protein
MVVILEAFGAGVDMSYLRREMIFVVVLHYD